MEQNAIDPVLVQGDLQNRIQHSPGVSLFHAGMNGLGATVSFPYLDPVDNTVKTTNSFSDWITMLGEYVVANPLIGLAAGGLLLAVVFGGTFAAAPQSRGRGRN